MSKNVSVYNPNTHHKKLSSKLSPPQLIVISFLAVILTGAVLLYLPVSHYANIQVKFIDALFTATSATCVTGLVTMTTATTWTVFGKIVIICLIQIGGLSLITIFFYFTALTSKKITIKNRLALQATFNAIDLHGMIKMVKMVIRGTLLIEGICAVILFFFFLNEGYPLVTSIGYGIFHSISAFCNAGFDIIGENSLADYSASLLMNFVIMGLIIVGGIGFSVWGNIGAKIRSHLNPKIKAKKRLTLQSKIALISTAFLLVSGAVWFLALEYNNPATLGTLSWPHKILASFFQSTTLRTAGFFSVPQFPMREASKFLSSIYMLIGGSPGGTAGGMKTTTVVIILVSLISVLKGKDYNTIMKRRISSDAVRRAIAVIVLMLTLLVVVTVVLSVTERNSPFEHGLIDLFYEVASGLGTVGLTTGITPYLTGIGKLILISCMFIGRVGPMTLIIALSAKQEAERDLVKYPNEELMIG